MADTRATDMRTMRRQRGDPHYISFNSICFSGYVSAKYDDLAEALPASDYLNWFSSIPTFVKLAS